MVFGISKSVQSLVHSKSCNVNGTFGSCPTSYSSSMRISTNPDASDDARWSFPCVWVLLTGKDGGTYDCLMSVLKSLGSFQTDTIMDD